MEYELNSFQDLKLASVTLLDRFLHTQFVPVQPSQRFSKDMDVSHRLAIKMTLQFPPWAVKQFIK